MNANWSCIGGAEYPGINLEGGQLGLLAIKISISSQIFWNILRISEIFQLECEMFWGYIRYFNTNAEYPGINLGGGQLTFSRVHLARSAHPNL